MYYTVYTTATCCTNCCCEKACRKARFGLFAPISPGEKSARAIATTCESHVFKKLQWGESFKWVSEQGTKSSSTAELGTVIQKRRRFSHTTLPFQIICLFLVWNALCTLRSWNMWKMLGNSASSYSEFNFWLKLGSNGIAYYCQYLYTK